MKTFAYTARDKTGKTIKGTMQMETSEALLEKLQASGLFCMDYREVKQSKGQKTTKFKTAEVAFFCRQLSSMLTAGLTLVKAMDILYKEQEDKRKKQILMEIYEDIQKGKSLSDAMVSQGDAFPELLVSMIAAGESSGTLDSVMTRMSEHYAKEGKTKNKVKSAMMYPMILGIITVVMVIGIFTLIMPQFMNMFKDAEMPFLTSIMMGISTFLRTKWYIYVPILVAAIIALKYWLSTTAGRYSFDKLKISMPVIGPLMVKIYTGRFSNTLSTMYSSGVPMIECLERAAAVLSNTYITDKFTQVITNVKSGEAISSAIAKTEIFESMFCSIIYVGEESGSLDKILKTTAEYYEEESDSAIQRMVSLLEPVMIIVLGVVIGLVIASVLPAMYGMFDSVSQ